LTRSLALGALLLAVSGAAFAAPAARRSAPRSALPDTVIARMPRKDITAREFVLAWHRVDPRYRPQGTTLAHRKAFLEQVIERELVARAALAEPFTMTDLESAQYLASRAQAVRRALYQRLVADSVTVTQADLDSARVRISHSDPSKPPAAEAVATFSRSLAEQRRAADVDSLIKRALQPAWDDSTAARLARGYGQLDPTKPDPRNPFAIKLRNRIPALAPEDTGRVLVRSAVGALTAGEFTRRFNLLNPFDSDFPTTIGEVEARGEQFLGSMWFDQEAARRGLETDPAVLDAARSRRESVALDHYFARHVAARVDTSDATLEAWFARNQARYAIAGHSVVTNLVAPNKASADSIYAEIKRGDAWEAVCERHVPAGAPMLAECGKPATIFDDHADTLLVRAVKKLAPGELIEHPLAPSNESYVVLKMIERVEPRARSFAEARTFVVREVQNDQGERLLQAELARLKKATPVTRNERALARVDLEL
jgi:hypothetical protein